MKRIQLVIAGDVQGVGFRAWVIRCVRNFNISGWVKNRPDGAVEVVAEGNKSDLAALIQSCHRGPEAARVTGVDITWSGATGEFDGFQVVY